MGIIGLPNVGKSTLFNALTQAAAAAFNYPFCTIEPNIGIVAVPDARFDSVVAAVQSEKVTPAAIQFVDIAGLVRGASKGEGLGNQFLAHIREVDALIHVVRCFPDENVSHVEGAELDPVRDIDIVQTELLLADIQRLENMTERLTRLQKTGETKYKDELRLVQDVMEQLNNGRPARNMSFTESQKKLVDSWLLLTSLPMLYCANVTPEQFLEIQNAEEHRHLDSPYAEVLDLSSEEGAGCIAIAAQLEAELQELDEEERQEFLTELGFPTSGLLRLIRASYRQLDLVTFYTIKGPETRAWIIPRGTTAPKAAGRIHSDMERGFIRAEVLEAGSLVELGSFSKAREEGVLRSEGKDYLVQDGDVMLIRFNV
ncbi:MAG: redox-regulated ATPase YchF [Firmicutes bacterium]|nr:redox-regulated ATPase YchF [Bacillota bacterium]